MEENCGETLYSNRYGLHSGKLKPSRSSKYTSSMNCDVTIETDVTHKINIVFRKMAIEYEPFCDDDFLSLYDGNTTSDNILEGIYTDPTIVFISE